ncbi:efflux RND transporter periplasmic adaptor subunit [Paenibacillus elgii]|uniref:efflux RND transporter periplasmic adaptor subunit n=1 Tax=Paenibacillus elgii TaxID=189691 RepID=UPI0026C0E37E|nr:efflux RND transporter periplasmic adaptor subunit [Paenibacillus elgii]
MYSKWWMENLSVVKKTGRPLLLVCIAASLALSSGCSLLPKEDEEEALPAITPPQLSKKPEYTVKTETLVFDVPLSGKLMSTVEEDLYFTDDANRRIKSLPVKTGDKVEQGQVIAELDVTEQENKLRQKRLQTRQDELSMIEKLRKADETGPEQLERDKIEFELKKEEVTTLEKTIAGARLTAPYAGTIISVYMKKGDSAKAYDAVATIADLSQLTVAATISADSLSKVAVGMEAEADINGVGKVKGKVSKLPSPKAANNGNGDGGFPGGGQQKKPDSIENYMLIQLDQFPEGLSHGTPLGVKIITQRKENAITIPPAALRSYAGRNYVQVVDDKGNKREVDVEIGLQTSTAVEIVKGLTAGQKVVGR